MAARPARELTDTVAAIESLESALDALELEVIAELEAGDGVKEEGWASTRDVVTAVTGGHLGSGPQLIRLSRDLADAVFTPVAIRARRRLAVDGRGRGDHPSGRRPAGEV